MVPDPVCASCHSSFVEKMENPADDPREYAHGDDLGQDGIPSGIETFLMSLQGLMDQGMGGSPRPRPENRPSNPRMTFQISSHNGSRVVTVGGPNTLGGQPANRTETRSRSPDRPETMSEFLRGYPGPDRDVGARTSTITGPLMAQYLMALLGQNDPLNALLGGSIPENGRMGDYVFNQEALDTIVTQLMENSNAHRPVPATEEIVAKLPRELLMEGSETLSKDCAVCKEQFKLESEDPDEQVVVTLPCKHPFHEPCITPWLKTSGTCPVCRFALIPQPDHQSPPTTSPRPDSNRSRPGSPLSRPRSPRSDNSPSTNGNFVQLLFSGLGRHNGNPTSQNMSSSTNRHNRSNSDPSRSSRPPSDTSGHLPGGWNDDLD